MRIDGEFRIYHNQSRISKDDFDRHTDIFFVPHDTCLITGQRLLLAKQTTQSGEQLKPIVKNSVQGFLGILFCGLCISERSLPQPTFRSFEGKTSGDKVNCDKGVSTCSFPSCREKVLDNKLFTYCYCHISTIFQESARILGIQAELESWETHCDSNIIKILQMLFVNIEPIITRLMASPNMTIMRNFCGACEIADAKCKGENLESMCRVCGGPCSVFEYISNPPNNHSIATRQFGFDKFTPVELTEPQMRLKIYIEGNCVSAPVALISTHVSVPHEPRPYAMYDSSGSMISPSEIFGTPTIALQRERIDSRVRMVVGDAVMNLLHGKI